MPSFSVLSETEHEQVVWCHHEASGLRALIAIHDTTLGPALGGCRLRDYASEDDALWDVLRLSRGMTYKSAIAGLDLGGGKAVILGDPSRRSEEMFRAFGRFVDSLGGRYITAADMNTGAREMDWIRRETRHVTGISPGLGGSGDPGPVTALGVFHGIRGAVDEVFGSPSLEGRTVAIQGVGSVGFELARLLHEAGASLVYADVRRDSVKRVVEAFGGRVVEGDAYFETPCDVLAPCAVGAVLDERTIPMLRASVVAGAANNVLAHEEEHAELLSERGIVYAPDYVVNSGGIISVYGELHGWSRDKVTKDASAVFDTTKKVLSDARAEGITTVAAANRLARRRIEAMARLRRMR